MPGEFKEDDLEDVFSDAEKPSATDGDSGKASEESGGEAKEGESPAPLTRETLDAEIAKVRSETLAEANKVLHAANAAASRREAPAPKMKEEPGDDVVAKRILQAIEMAAEKSPKSVPQLVDKLVEHRLSKAEDRFLKRAEDRFTSRTAADRLRTNIIDTYRDDIANPQSEIAARAVRERDSVIGALSEFMTPEQAERFQSSPVADQLAYAVGAALSPEQVARQAITRHKAKQAERDREIGRLSGMSSAGASQRRGEGPKITDTDREIAAEYGIDLDDEKVKARVLQSKAGAADDFVIMGSVGQGDDE